jgi:hypothetical protein
MSILRILAAKLSGRKKTQEARRPDRRTELQTESLANRISLSQASIGLAALAPFSGGGRSIVMGHMPAPPLVVIYQTSEAGAVGRDAGPVVRNSEPLTGSGNDSAKVEVKDQVSNDLDLVGGSRAGSSHATIGTQPGASNLRAHDAGS